MSTASSRPTEHLLVLMDSEAGDCADTDIVQGFVIDIDDALRQRIDEAHALLVARPYLHSIAINCLGIAVAGREGRQLAGIELDAATEAQLDAVFAALSQEDTRAVTAAEREAYAEVEYTHSGGERLVVFATMPPIVMLHETGGYEPFRSRSIYELVPTGLRAQLTAVAA